MDKVQHRWQTERRRPWGATAREATDAVVARLTRGSDRIHVLREDHVDVQALTLGGGVAPLRIMGSPLTPLVQEDPFGADPGDVLAGHNTLKVSQAATTARRWDALLERGDVARASTILVCHGPPYGILDLVGGTSGTKAARRCGCEALADALARHRCPALCVFGHVHARQSRGEPWNGPRFVVSRRHPGTDGGVEISKSG